jgi:flagellin-like hook-associated protein FlgL
MRIAGGTILRRFMHNLERNQNNKNNAENQLYSRRSFNRASENPIQAARALRVRKAIYDIEIQQNNLKRADMLYQNAEASVMKVSAIMQSVYESLIHGAHGSVNRDDAGIIAETIDQYADEIVQLMNVVVADRRIFGGLNNSQLAFSIDDGPGGKIVKYHGIATTIFQDHRAFPFSGVSYTDVGIGLTMQNTGRIDPQSAIPVTFNGMEILGCGLSSKTQFINLEALNEGEIYSLDVTIGADRRTVTFQAGATTEDSAANLNSALFARLGHGAVSVGANSGIFLNNIAGRPDLTIVNTPHREGQPPRPQAEITTTPSGFSGNVIQLVLDSAQALKADDRLLAAQLADAIFALQTNVSLTLARMGNTTEFIEFNLSRTTNNKMSLIEQQSDLEDAKPEEMITKIKVFEAMFGAQLQMGASVIPMSIFNFIK